MFPSSYAPSMNFVIDFKKSVAVKWLETNLDLNLDLTLDLLLDLTLELRNTETRAVHTVS